ncbi:hypothetical protein C5167_044643 [Papaver somniferum]|uniref:Protein kinase domain-containing protein n=1 Tax=Papaver somniferum TaxID=3469 RepID=A0A4Y7LBP0_PAPSO|nr:hypothetical protein C5167_044643 [Papaver somniferum]
MALLSFLNIKKLRNFVWLLEVIGNHPGTSSYNFGSTTYWEWESDIMVSGHFPNLEVYDVRVPLVELVAILAGCIGDFGEFFVDENSQLKAIDFGLSDFVKPDKRLNDIVGSAYYVASEVLHRSYNTEADVWSIGVISYMLLCGSCPFLARTESEIFLAFRADSMNLLGLLYLLKPSILSSVILGLVTAMIFKLMKAYMRSSSLHKAALRGKKRLAEVANNKPTLGQKCADGKKGGDVRQGTPYPKGGKTPASGGKSKKSLLGHSVQFTVENGNRPVFLV